jgi:hypothetical protein
MAATLATRRELETVLVLVLILVRGVDLHVVSVGLSKPRPKRLVYLRKGFEKVYLRV